MSATCALMEDATEVERGEKESGSLPADSASSAGGPDARQREAVTDLTTLEVVAMVRCFLVLPRAPKSQK